MTRIIGVLNHKGGTGKTTTVVNLAAGLAQRGFSVLCLDLDAQGGMAACLDVQYTYTVAHLLLGQAGPYGCIVRARENLDLIPADRSLFQAEGELWRLENQSSARRRLRRRMEAVEGYQYILIDFSPSLSLVGESGLMYCREILIPVRMGYLALKGTRQVVETLRYIEQFATPPPALSLIVPTFFRGRQRKDREAMRLLERYFGQRVARPIRADVRVAEAPGHGKTIYEYAPRSAGAADYRALVERVIADG